MSQSRVLVSGSLAYDRIMNYGGVFSDHILPEKVHTLSVSFVVDALVEHFGGTAGNIAYSLALLGMRPVVLGSAGNDFGRYKKHLNHHGVGTTCIRIVASDRTASASIMTDTKDNQITAFHPGALAHASIKYQVSSIKRLLKDVAFAIVSPGNVDDMRALPTVYKKHHIPYAYDPGQMLPALSKSDLIFGLTGADVLFVNDYELELLKTRTGLSHAAIRDKVRALVTTLGERGSRIECDGKTYKIPSAKPRAIVDPTGAGDAYRAGFIHGLFANWDWPTIGRFAGLIAVYTVEKLGTQTHTFTFNGLRSCYKANFGVGLPRE